MATVACVFLLLSCSIATQAIPTVSLASPPVARSSGIRGTTVLDEMLVKRTSGSPSLHRLSLRRQSTGLQSVPSNDVPIGAPLAPLLG